MQRTVVIQTTFDTIARLEFKLAKDIACCYTFINLLQSTAICLPESEGIPFTTPPHTIYGVWQSPTISLAEEVVDNIAQ